MPTPSCSWSAPRRSRWRPCTWARSWRRPTCRCATAASRRASGARPAPRARTRAGIFRTHQFDKVEMFSFCHPDRSWEEHEHLLAIEREIADELGLHYRVMNIAVGDLGAPAAKKYDIEAWLPGQGRYRELTSCSNTTDFQARRLDARYRSEKGVRHLHTLNGTAVTSSRTLIAVLETHQRERRQREHPRGAAGLRRAGRDPPAGVVAPLRRSARGSTTPRTRSGRPRRRRRAPSRCPGRARTGSRGGRRRG